MSIDSACLLHSDVTFLVPRLLLDLTTAYSSQLTLPKDSISPVDCQPSSYIESCVAKVLLDSRSIQPSARGKS